MKKEWIIIGLVVGYIVLKNRQAAATASQPSGLQKFFANLSMFGGA